MLSLVSVKVVAIPLIHLLWSLVMKLHMVEAWGESAISINGQSLIMKPLYSSCSFFSAFSILKVIIWRSVLAHIVPKKRGKNGKKANYKPEQAAANTTKAVEYNDQDEKCFWREPSHPCGGHLDFKTRIRCDRSHNDNLFFKLVIKGPGLGLCIAKRVIDFVSVKLILSWVVFVMHSKIIHSCGCYKLDIGASPDTVVGSKTKDAVLVFSKCCFGCVEIRVVVVP